MFKVLIVDDEVFVRKGLQKLIPWEEFHFTIAGEAKHGGEALDLIKQLSPDLVITDIMMPVLDGLGLIRSVKEEGDGTADPEFIIISGYNEFKYAQQAIRYGVQDYILKPIDVKEMEETLVKLAGTIRKKRLIALTKERFSRDGVLEMLLQDKLPAEEDVRYEELLGLEPHEPELRFLIVEVHTGPFSAPISLKSFREAWAVCGPGWEKLPLVEHCPCRFGTLLAGSQLRELEPSWPQTLELCRQELATKLQQEVTFYAGGSKERLSEVRQSYLEANEAMKHKYAEGCGRVIVHQHVKAKPLDQTELEPGLFNRLLVELEENNKEAFAQTAMELQLFLQRGRFTPSAAVHSISRFLERVLLVVKQMGGNEEELRQLLACLEEEYPVWTLPQLTECFLRITGEAAQSIDILRKDRNKGDIERIKKYIDSHYADNMNLKNIAALFYMNPVYLGQLFRKTYGVYFNDYLLERRVEEAKKLLRQTDLRMYEIAERVGIKNANYFVSQFEKLVKLSPMEYRNKLVKKE
jgi:two-component system, response regulator YesN